MEILKQQYNNHNTEDYKRFDLTKNLGVLLNLITSFTPIDIVALISYNNIDKNFTFSGYFTILEDENNRFVFYHVNNELIKNEDLIKEIYNFLKNSDSESIKDINTILFKNEKFKDLKDVLYFMYFDNITFSRFYEIMETENTTLVDDIDNIKSRLDSIDESEYETIEDEYERNVEYGLEQYILEKKYIRKGPSSRIKNPVAPIIRNITHPKTGRVFQRVYYARVDKLQKNIQTGKISASDLHTINENKALNRIIYGNLKNVFGDEVEKFIKNPEEFGLDAFSMLGKTQYYKDKLLRKMEEAGVNLGLEFEIKPKKLKRLQNGIAVETTTTIRLGGKDVITSDNKMEITKESDYKYKIKMESKSKMVKNNDKLKELIELLNKDNLTPQELKTIQDILDNKASETTRVVLDVTTFNQHLKDGTKKLIRNASIVEFEYPSNLKYYPMLEFANMIDFLRNRFDRIEFNIPKEKVQNDSSDFRELFTKAILVGFELSNDNKGNFNTFATNVLNNIGNHPDPEIQKLAPRIQGLLQDFLNEVNNPKSKIDKPLKEFLARFYREIKSPRTYITFANEIKKTYINDKTRLSFNTQTMTKDGKRSRSELILDTYHMLADIDNLRYRGVIKKDRKMNMTSLKKIF